VKIIRLAVYAQRVRSGLAEYMPDLVDELSDQDLLAMQMVSPLSRRG